MKNFFGGFKNSLLSIKSNFFSDSSTYHKRWNYIKLLWNISIKKAIVLNNYPSILNLDTGPICNLKCKLCPVGENRAGRKRGFLERKVVELIIEELGDYLDTVYLFSWGEPLLNKNLFDYIRLFKEANITVIVSTNLNIFSENICKEIVDSGLDKLNVSLHGCSQNSLDSFQIGNNFKLVISNIKKIVEYKHLKGVNHPFLRWRFLVNRFNENEIEKARKMSKEIGFDKFKIGFLSCDIGYEVFLDPESQFSNVEPYIPKNEKLSKYDYKKREKKKTKSFCGWLWNYATINWNGSVSPCCAVWDESYDFGNILETPFKEIWNGKKFQLARRIITSDKPINAPKIICSICKKNKAIVF